MEMNMKRLAIAVALAVSAGSAYATPVYHPPGPNLSYGDVSNGQTIMSDITNPAAGAAVIKKNGNQYRFGVLSSVGVGAEFGQVDDLYNKIEAQSDAYDTGAGVNLDFSDTSQIGGLVNDQRDVINDILADVEDNGYAKAFVSAHLPIMPLVVAHKAFGGSIVVDINGSVTSKVYGLHDTIVVDGVALQTAIENDITNNTVQPSYTNGDVTIAYDQGTGNANLTVDNDSSVVAKAAYTAEVALGYSRPVFNSDTGTLYAGLRGRYYQVGLTRKAIRLSNLDNVEQELDNISDEDLETSTAIGVDAGVLWVEEHYRVGATLTNINEPSFKYPTFDTTPFNNPNGIVATTIAADDTYTMESQLKLEAALYSANQNWVLSAAMDANPVVDPMGDEYQWATASGAYATDSWLIPGLRLGYRKNLAGSELSYATAGLTLFKVLNLDVAYGLESVTIDGETVPRSLMANLGLEVTF
jgi:hypothetical protein